GIARWQERFDDQEFSVVPNRVTTILEDRHGPFIVPVPDHPHEHVCIAAGRDRFEEAAADDIAALCDAGIPEQLARARDRVWPREQSTPQRRSIRKNAGE